MNLALVKGSAFTLEETPRRTLEESYAMAEHCLRDVRTITYLLHPPLLDECGLASALRWYADGFAQRSGIQVHLDLPLEFGRLTQEEEMALFRIVQESLTNVHRHSGSPTAGIRLVRDASVVTLEIMDAGRGIPEDVLSGSSGTITSVGVGIMGMQERMRQLGGALGIEGGNRGTTVRAVLTLGPAAA
jgi:signal transduction histidine kinase